ncbi:MAG: DnaB-like helicase N-terminal domain-containing protein [Pseudonocardia sp.]
MRCCGIRSARADVSGWLSADDFRRPAHAAIYQTLLGLQRDGEQVDLLALPQVLASGRYHDLHVARDGTGPLGAPALHSLLSMTPATPRSAAGQPEAGGSEHVRYARIVLEDSIRRRVCEMGSCVGQHAAHLDGVPSDSNAEILQAALAEVGTQLDALAARRDRAELAGSRLAAALESPESESRGLSDRSVAARGTLPSAGPDRVPPPPEQLHEIERRLVGAAIGCPPVRELLDERVRPTDFLASDAGATWHAIQSILRRGEPVDVVLVAVEVERQGEVPDLGAGFSADRLAALHARRPDVVEGYRSAEVVLRAALTRATARAAARLHELGNDRRRGGKDALVGARTAVAAVEATARRLTGSPPAAALVALTPPPQRTRTPIAPNTTRTRLPVPSGGAAVPLPDRGRRHT